MNDKKTREPMVIALATGKARHESRKRHIPVPETSVQEDGDSDSL